MRLSLSQLNGRLAMHHHEFLEITASAAMHNQLHCAGRGQAFELRLLTRVAVFKKGGPQNSKPEGLSMRIFRLVAQVCLRQSSPAGTMRGCVSRGVSAHWPVMPTFESFIRRRPTALVRPSSPDGN
jgi:hypothetical protein